MKLSGFRDRNPANSAREMVIFRQQPPLDEASTRDQKIADGSAFRGKPERFNSLHRNSSRRGRRTVKMSHSAKIDRFNIKLEEPKRLPALERLLLSSCFRAFSICAEKFVFAGDSHGSVGLSRRRRPNAEPSLLFSYASCEQSFTRARDNHLTTWRQLLRIRNRLAQIQHFIRT